MDGLYVSITPEGKLKRHLSVRNREVPLEDTTVEHEIMKLLDTNYRITVQFVKEQLKKIPRYQASKRTYCCFLNTIERFLYEQESTDLLYSLLTQTVMRDQADHLRDINTAPSQILLHLLAPIHSQFIAVGVVDAMISGMSIMEQSVYSLLCQTKATAVCTLTDEQTIEFVFRSFLHYYTFLLQKFIASNPSIAKCQYCGRYFFPKTKRRTLYCDRIIRNGKTCKQIAPYENHKRLAAANRVVAEFDRVKDLMFRRTDRTCVDKKKSPIDLSYEQYYAWLDNATLARDQFLAGEISEEEALSIIHVPTKKELLEKESADYTLDSSLASS